MPVTLDFIARQNERIIGELANVRGTLLVLTAKVDTLDAKVARLEDTILIIREDIAALQGAP